MAKRFMDNTIFDKSWYRKLPVRLKIVWFYLINKCNHTGLNIMTMVEGYLDSSNKVFLILEKEWLLGRRML